LIPLPKRNPNSETNQEAKRPSENHAFHCKESTKDVSWIADKSFRFVNRYPALAGWRQPPYNIFAICDLLLQSCQSGAAIFDTSGSGRARF
jgi:hypothetical protein